MGLNFRYVLRSKNAEVGMLGFSLWGPRAKNQETQFPIGAPSTTIKLKSLKLFVSNETKDALFSLGLREAQR